MNYTTNIISSLSTIILKRLVVSAVVFTLYIASANYAEAATLSLSPSTGVYSSNSTFSMRVLVNTQGKPVNAADGTLSFNPNELSVVSVNRVGSIFNLWVAEPAFSNAAGTISFSGGLPSGYTGSSGNIMTITFRTKGSGTARVSFTEGSVLANDGRGTNILTAMKSGTYTIQAKSTTPEPEVIEYVAPANTPGTPIITSDTHNNPDLWYPVNQAVLNWSLPSGVTAVRTLLNDIPTSVPTKVYNNPIHTITLSDLDEGVSYFHLQFKNSDGWGKVAHYRLAIDSVNPSKIDISLVADSDLANPNQVLQVKVVDKTSLVRNFKVKLDEAEPFDFQDETGSSTIPLTSLNPGYHTVIVEAFDQAGNSIIGTYSFTIQAFDKPVFTDYPSEINEEVIPVIKGLTRANAQVEVSVYKVGSEPATYSIMSDEDGVFVFIPEGTFTNGVYELFAVAKDKFGAQSDQSDVIRIAVQQPGYLKIGSMIVSVLSVIVPLIILLFLLVVGTWYLWAYVRRFRRRVRVESLEAMEMLRAEFASLQSTLRDQKAQLEASRKTKKLTKAEASMIQEFGSALQSSRLKVEKEIQDVAELTRKTNKN